MPSKYQIMRDLADKMQTEVLSSEGTYLAFLRTAARNYKYNFKEQLLIFEQKPDAVACAGIDVWNRLGRWVNKGTKGIVQRVYPKLNKVVVEGVAIPATGSAMCST